MYLGFGSNLGDREETIRRAIRGLESPELTLKRVSGFYETKPMGIENQPWFVNAGAEFETALFPLQLLHRVQKMERALGRVRTVRNGPRTIDIDILLYGNSIVKTADLEIPHPRFRERRFVLAPLAELNPSLRDPVTGCSVAELLTAVSDQAVRKIDAHG